MNSSSLAIAFVILFSILPYAHVHATPYVTTTLDKPKKMYKIYELFLHVKINGKSLKMQLDTGSDISQISGHYVHDLGLDKLKSSDILNSKEDMISANGHHNSLKSVDVNMSIENSTSFKTGILIDPTDDCNLLSIHDFIHVFGGIQLKPVLKLNSGR